MNKKILLITLMIILSIGMVSAASLDWLPADYSRNYSDYVMVGKADANQLSMTPGTGTLVRSTTQSINGDYSWAFTASDHTDTVLGIGNWTNDGSDVTCEFKVWAPADGNWIDFMFTDSDTGDSFYKEPHMIVQTGNSYYMEAYDGSAYNDYFSPALSFDLSQWNTIKMHIKNVSNTRTQAKLWYNGIEGNGYINMKEGMGISEIEGFTLIDNNVENVKYADEFICYKGEEAPKRTFENYINIIEEPGNNLALSINGADSWNECGYNIWSKSTPYSDLKFSYNDCDDFSVLDDNYMIFDTGDIAIDGTFPLDNDEADIHGWDTQTAYRYENTDSYSGDLSLYLYDNNADETLLTLSNYGTFDKIKYKLKFTGSLDGDAQIYPMAIHRDFGGPGVIEAQSSTYLTCYDSVGGYSVTSIPFQTTSWMDVEFNQTASNWHVYVDGVDMGCAWPTTNQALKVYTAQNSLAFAYIDDVQLIDSTNQINVTVPFEVEQTGEGYQTSSAYSSALTYHFGEESDYSFVDSVPSVVGKLSNAYDFSGVETVNTPTGVVQTDITLAYWVYPDTIDTSSDYHTQASSPTPFFNLWTDSDSCGAGNFCGTFGSATDYQIGTLTAAQWNHVLVTVQDSKLSVWINGVNSVTNTTLTSWSDASAQYLKIGDSSATRFDGKIDDFRVYNKSVNTAEVASIYNSGLGTQSETIAPDYLTFHMTAEIGKDSSSGGNNATIIGTDVTDGIFGKALSFDGVSDYVTFPNYCIDSDYSISLWVNKSDWSVNSNFVDLGSGISTREFYLRNNAGQINWASWSQDGNNYYDFTTTGLSLNNNQWYYMVALLNNSGIFLYIDGVLVGQDTSAASNPKSCTSDLVQLMRDNRDTGYTKGQMDEFRIYDKALSSTEINDIYYNSKSQNMMFEKSYNSRYNITHESKYLSPLSLNGIAGLPVCEYNAWVPNNIYEDAQSYEDSPDTRQMNLFAAFDDSDYNYDIYGATGTTEGMYFDTSDKIDVGDINFCSQSSDWSVSTRVKSSDISGSNDGAFFFCDDLNIRIRLSRDLNPDKISVTYNDGGYKDLASSITAINGEWYNVTVTFNSSDNTLSLYVDGSLENSVVEPSFASLSDTIRWGDLGAQTNTISDTRLYTKALSATEVSNNNATDSLLFKSDLTSLKDSSSDNVGTATVTGATKSPLGPGEILVGIDFDGSSDYILTNNFYRAGDWAFSGWMRKDSAGSPYMMWSDKTSEYQYLYTSSATAMTYYNGNFGDSNTWTIPTILTGEWVYVTLNSYTSDNKMELWINGVSQGNKTFTNPSTLVNNEKNIGRYGWGASSYFDGGLSDFIWWNKTLTQSDINNIYNNKIKANTVNNDSVLAYYPLSGALGRAYKFDGTNDYITPSDEIKNWIMGSENNDYTIGFWYQPNVDKSSSCATQEMIFSVNGASCTGSVNIHLDSSCYIQIEQGGTSIEMDTTVNDWSAGEWYYYVYVHNATGTSKVYLNGYLNASDSDDGKDTGTPCSIDIGRQFNSASYLDGKLDEFVFYKRGLSDTEVETLYQAGLPTKKAIDVDSDGLVWYNDMGDSDYISMTGNNGVKLDVNGKLNQSMYFDGTDDSISYTQPAITNGYSISTWFKLNTIPSNAYKIIWGQASVSDTYIGVYSATSMKISSIGEKTLTVPTLSPNIWYHLVFSMSDDNTGTLYINGIKADSDTFSQDVLDSATFYLGSYNTGSTYNFNGLLDQFAIYDKALSASEAHDLYYSSKDLYMDFNSCDDFVVVDEDNNRQPYDVEQTDYKYFENDVYDTNTELVYHFGDVSSNDYTVNGATGIDGKIGNAYDFDGSDYIQIISPPTVFTTDGSICLWGSATANNQAFFSYGDGLSTNYIGWFFDGTGDLNFQVRGTFGNDDISSPLLGSSVYDEWHYYCLIKNGTNAKLYVDGVEKTSSTVDASWTESGNMYLGTGSTSSFQLIGGIDDFRLYNSTLTTSQISDLYNSGSGTQYENIEPDNLVFHSTMESGSDSTSNSNDGTVNGATYISDGVYSGAMSFDGTNDYIKSSTKMPSYENAFTISLFLNMTDDSTIQWVFGNYELSPRHILGARFSASNQLWFWSEGTGEIIKMYDWNPVWNNKFINLVFTKESGTGIGLLNTYVNGELLTAASTSGTASTNTPVQDFSIGTGTDQSGNPHTEYLEGVIDEFRIYNRALLPEEITDLYLNSQNKNMLLEEIQTGGVTNSSWNITSNNLADGVETTVWNTGEQAIFTSDVASFTVTTDYNTNGSCALNRDWTYEQMVEANESYKLATTETISHSGTLADSIPLNKDNCMFCSFIKTDGTGSNTPTIIQQSHDMAGTGPNVGDGYYAGTMITLDNDYYIRNTNFTIGVGTGVVLNFSMKLINASSGNADASKVLAECNALYTGLAGYDTLGCDLGGYRLLAGVQYGVIYEIVDTTGDVGVFLYAGTNTYPYGHGITKPTAGTIMDNQTYNFGFNFSDQVIGGSTSGCLPITREISSTCIYSGSGNWEIDASEGCTVSESYDVGGNDIIVSGAGNILINKAPNNYGDFRIQGQDASNKAYVRWELI